MTDEQKAQRLLDMASRRLAGHQISILEDIRDEGHLRSPGVWFDPEEEQAFKQLCTEFSRDLQ